MTDRPTCPTCPYWQQHEYNDDKDPTELTAGLCRRHSPRPSMGRMLKEEPLEEFPVWPETFSSEWCGDHPDFPAYLEARARKSVDRSGRGQRAPRSSRRDFLGRGLLPGPTAGTDELLASLGTDGATPELLRAVPVLTEGEAFVPCFPVKGLVLPLVE